MSDAPPPEFHELCARLGGDRLQVQGPGGNTSYKDGDTMWVKASGTRLQDATSSNIFVSLPYAKVVAALDATEGEPDLTGLIPEGSLRPSIETTFHALLPHKVVLHTHSVATIAHAVSDEGIAQLNDKLSGFNWHLVPYAMPGAQLTRAMRRMVGGTEPIVLVLANHGLIVADVSVDKAAGLLATVEERLRLGVATKGDAPSNDDVPGWQWHSDCSTLATDPLACERAVAGSLYPDHVVFLGPGMPVVEHPVDAKTLSKLGRPAVLVKNRGVLVKEGASASVDAMLCCLHDVLCRVPPGWTLNTLGKKDEAELLGWDAEKYRQKLERQRRQ